jgi:hypothetical protein
MAWLSDYSACKIIPITGATGAGTNTQVQVTVHSGAGTDSAGVIYLQGHCTDFPNDIRFTANDGETELAHWPEDSTADPVIFWVKVAADLGSNQSIYIYFGKSGASSGIDGDETFEFFDDFEDESIDTDKWETDNNVSEAGGVLLIEKDGVGNSYARGKTTYQQFGIGYAIHTRAKVSVTDAGADYCQLADLAAGGNGDDRLRWQARSSDSRVRSISENGNTETVNDYRDTDTDYYNWEIRWFDDSGTPTAKFYEDGVLKYTHTTNVPTDADTDLTPAFVSYGTNNVLTLEYVFVRKCIATEPTVGTASTFKIRPTAISGVSTTINPTTRHRIQPSEISAIASSINPTTRHRMIPTAISAVGTTTQGNILHRVSPTAITAVVASVAPTVRHRISPSAISSVGTTTWGAIKHRITPTAISAVGATQYGRTITKNIRRALQSFSGRVRQTFTGRSRQSLGTMRDRQSFTGRDRS